MRTEDFLARVVPPGNHIALAFNTEPGKKQPRFGATRMFTDAASAANFVGWINHKSFEGFHCLASYRLAEAKTKPNGKVDLVGSKDASNAVRSQALYLDLDVHRPGDGKNPGVNCYASRAAAIQWLSSFLAATGIPKPSILVDSGYGYHPYWVLEDPLAPNDWLVAAHCLKAAMVQHGYTGDAGITTDIARILRTPGTKNFKDPANPQDVKVAKAGPSIANAVMLQALQPWLAQATQIAATGAAHVSQAAGQGAGAVSMLAGGGPAAALAGTTTTVGGAAAAQMGVPAYTSGHKYHFRNIATACEQVKESLRTQGNGDAYPLWYGGFMTLAAFCEDGDQYVHPISQGDPRYTQAGVDAAWQRVQQEKANKTRLGPPLCTTLQACRPSACAVCPHWGKIRSPIVLGRDDSDLPNGYRRGAAGLEQLVTDADGNVMPVLVVPGDITEFVVDITAGSDQVTFRYRRAQTDRTVRLAMSDMLGLAKDRLRAFFSEFGITVLSPDAAIRMREMIVAWTERMKAAEQARTVETPPFGWVEGRGGVAGFALAGKLYKPGGAVENTASGDPNLLPHFGSTGDLAAWRRAADFVTANRPDLAVLVASSFGAPLMRFTGQSGCVVSCISRGSGIGKSSAIKVGAAIWGHPVKSAHSLTDTMNMVIHKIGETRALPAYWDELRTAGDAKQFVSLAFQLTQGREKARMGPDLKAREVGSWQTLLVAAANEPLMEHIVEEVQGTEAGALRLFEYQVELGSIPVVPGAAQIIDAVMTNYGVLGPIYARWLADNAAYLAQQMPVVIDRLNQRLGARAEERFYIAAIACILQGAAIAVSQGWATLDVTGIRDFLFDVFNQLRVMRGMHLVSSSQGFDLEEIMSGFMSSVADQRLVTNIYGQGRQFVHELAPPLNKRNVVVHIGVNAGTMRIQRTAFTRYLREKNISYQSVVAMMEKQWGAAVRKGTIGACTQYSIGQTWVVEIPLTAPGMDIYAVTQGDKPT